MFSVYCFYIEKKGSISAFPYSTFNCIATSRQEAELMLRSIVGDVTICYSSSVSVGDDWDKAMVIAGGRSGYFRSSSIHASYAEIFESEFIVYKTREEKIDALLG